jgi:hypothetical protein
MNGRDDRAALETAWVRVGAVAGLLCAVAYFFRFSRRWLPLPEPLDLVPYFSFGPLLAVASLGLYHLLRRHRDGPLAQTAALFNVIAGVLVTAMFVVQSATFTWLAAAARGAGADRALAHEIGEAVNTVQLGLGMCWDLFISCGTVLFGVAMLRHPRFGRLFGGSGVVAGAAPLVLNFLAFPTPPAEAGLVDLGPLIGIWYAVVVVQIFRSVPWMTKRAPA